MNTNHEQSVVSSSAYNTNFDPVLKIPLWKQRIEYWQRSGTEKRTPA
jgi:hypothetical protein